MYSESMERPPLRHRVAALFDRAESVYLVVLRATILIVATLLLAYCIWLGVSSLYKISRSPDSVVEEQASVSADDLIDAQAPAPTAPSQKSGVNPAYRDYYSHFVDRYYALFRSKFEPYRQPDDKQLSKEEFDGAFLNTGARLDAIKSGDLTFESDRDDLETLYRVMSEAADKAKTVERLRLYKAAKKIPVTSQVERTKVTYERGWDSGSTACPGWYEDPIGCPVTRPVEQPYTESVTTMQYPKGTMSHIQLFRAFQDRFFSLLRERREANAAKAEHQRQDIIASIADGKVSLVTALQVLGAFLALMFFFLLIAIERHQRRISATIGPEESGPDIIEATTLS